MGNALQEFFKRIPLFADLTSEELGELLRAVRPVELTQGQVVFRAGEPGDAAYVVEHGAVEVESPGGRILASLGPGEVFGELALLDGAPRSATLRATRPSKLFRIDKAEFDFQRRNLRTPAYKVMRRMAITLAGRIRETNAQIGELLAPAPVAPAPAADAEGGFFKKVFSWIRG